MLKDWILFSWNWKTRISILTTLILYSAGSSSQCIKVVYEIRHIDWKGRTKYLFADNVTVYMENPKISTKISENW